MKQIRTDLAIEAHEMLIEAAIEPEGVRLWHEDRPGARVTRVSIESETAQRQMGKPVGHYVTIEFDETEPGVGETYEALCRTVAEELVALLPPLEAKSQILVVGLGNWNITPDALGPKVVSQLMVTRHLLDYIPEQLDENIRPVCAVSPGVLGITGIETGEIVRGVTDSVSPEAVIVVDALAARSIDRISTTIQICDTGISPGAGVGNRRKALNRSTLGVPVIAVGVPTVIDAATIVTDSLQQVSAEGRDNGILGAALAELDREAQYSLLYKSLPESIASFMVTPKDVDLMIERIARVVANGINLALHPGIDFSDIAAYTS